MASNEISPLSSPCEQENEPEQSCNVCNKQYEQPRVLSCLHFFCEDCLEKLLNECSRDSGLVTSQNYLLCPDCGQETKLTSKGIPGLPLNHVLCNQLDMSAIENMQVVCTSCKAKKKAVARCSDCANFLCPHCVTAHQFMRCFENHKVVTFEEMKDNSDGLTIHKPITCYSHTGEFLKYYCYTCQLAVCNECLVTEHKQPEHHYERASDCEVKQREELDNLVSESKSKVQFCDDATTTLQSSLSDLQMQRDDAKSLIKETFQSYKAILEKREESLLDELESIHSNQELSIMDTLNSVEKTIYKIEDACKFAEQLLKNGNTIELLSLKNFVGSQLLYLINNTPKPDVNTELKLETNISHFEESVLRSFGPIRQARDRQQLKSLETSTPPHSSPLHSSSSFDSDHFALPGGVLSPDSGSVPSLDMDLTNNVVAQFNLAQLAGMAADRRSPRGGSPSPTQSTPITLSDLLITASSNDVVAQLNALNNLSALAKLGSASHHHHNHHHHHHDDMSMDGMGNQQRSGSSASSVAISSSNQSQMRRMQSPPIDVSLGGLLNGSSGVISTPQRVSSPMMDSNLVNGVNLNHGLSRVMTPSSQSSSSCSYNPPPRSANTKLNSMQISCLPIRCKFGQLGPSKGQFSSPHGFCLGIEEEIIVADTNNHRIQVFDKIGEFKFQFGIPGKEEGQLWYPRKVAVIRKTGKFVICDRGNERSRMQIFTKTGHFIKKIAIRYIDIVAGLAITSEGHIVAVDSVSPTVFVISETGDLLQWFDCSEYMREPSDIAISNKEYYICDFKGHCVIVFNEEGQFQHRIGCENITNFPNGIDISDAGDVLVGDSHGNRFHVVVFSRDGSILSEFECPYVKVSRCCGLKITSEGYIVTLAKNNHHVLILNTLYIM